MSVFPPLRGIRPHLPMVVGALVLTQVPVVPFLLLGGRPGRALTICYVVASAASALGLVAVGLAWWERIERVVSLVRVYAEEGRLPSGNSELEGGSVRRVKASLNSLDRALRSLENEAARDPLTGILNRRTCSARLEGDLARSRRSGIPFSVAVFDLDGLKLLNDQFGHASGDQALRHFASILSSATREGDWVARWGGDEFVLGLWSADLDAAAGAASRIMNGLSTQPAPLGERESVLSASVGIAQALEGDTATGLFSRADGALLKAKRDGRGRVCAA
jgi:diguanylate cyclase (GGDEF)-like protein